MFIRETINTLDASNGACSVAENNIDLLGDGSDQFLNHCVAHFSDKNIDEKVFSQVELDDGVVKAGQSLLTIFDHDFLKEQLPYIPFTLRRSMVRTHKKNKEQGYKFAKQQLLEIIESVKKPRLIEALDIDARDDNIREHAKYLADKYRAIACRPRLVKVALFMAETMLGEPIFGDSTDSQINRICDEKFWRKRTRKMLRVHREHCHLRIAPEKLRHCSPDARREYKSMLDNHAKWAADHEFVNEAGEKIPAPSPESTAKNRYAQLVAQTVGIGSIATEKKMTPKIITITLDSQYHSAMGTDRRVRNPKYKNISPKAGHAWLNKKWRNFRAVLKTKTRDIDTHWVVGVHAHKNMTPHWHFVLWTEPKNWTEVEKLIQKYFRTNDNPAQIQIESPKNDGGAVAYCMKILQYITRQVGTGDGEGEEDIAEAFDTSAWASTFGIRRYRTSDCATTLWRLARKDDIEAPSEIKNSATTGDYAGFLKSVKEYEATIIYVQKNNQYGDGYKAPKGISFKDGVGIKSSVSLAKWKIQTISKDENNTKDDTYSKTPRTSKAESTAKPKNQDSLWKKYHSLQNKLIESEETEINGLADSVKNELRAVLG